MPPSIACSQDNTPLISPHPSPPSTLNPKPKIPISKKTTEKIQKNLIIIIIRERERENMTPSKRNRNFSKNSKSQNRISDRQKQAKNRTKETQNYRVMIEKHTRTQSKQHKSQLLRELKRSKTRKTITEETKPIPNNQNSQNFLRSFFQKVKDKPTNLVG